MKPLNKRGVNMSGEGKVTVEKEPVGGSMPNEERRKFVKKLAALGIAFPMATLLVDGSTKVSAASWEINPNPRSAIPIQPLKERGGKMSDEGKDSTEKGSAAVSMPNEERRRFVKKLAALGIAVP
jgi:hypothetical protein